jgi:hypothetical protein
MAAPAELRQLVVEVFAHFASLRFATRRFGDPAGCERTDDGEGRNRTGDTTIFSRVLYQLSYLARSD